MANLEHSDLTDPNLHEPKGISAALVDTVYVADGADSGDWKQVPAAALEAAAKPFENMLIIQNRQAMPVLTASTWNSLNASYQTLTQNDIGATNILSQLTLPSGTYYMQGKQTFRQSSGNTMKLRLWNNTTSASLIDGQISNGLGSTSNVDCSIAGKFTLAGTSVIYLQAYSNTATTEVLASSVSAPYSPTIFGEMTFWKLA